MDNTVLIRALRYERELRAWLMVCPGGSAHVEDRILDVYVHLLTARGVSARDEDLHGLVFAQPHPSGHRPEVPLWRDREDEDGATQPKVH